jgi:hypothetical protein
MGGVVAEIHVFLFSSLVGVASFTAFPLYPLLGNGPQYPLGRRLGGSQSQSGLYRGMKIVNLNGGSNSEPWVVQPGASLYIDRARIIAYLITIFQPCWYTSVLLSPSQSLQSNVSIALHI